MEQRQAYQTKNSRRILAYAKSQEGSYFSAQDVNAHFTLEGSAVSLPTIYRQLERLHKGGALSRFRANDSTRAHYLYIGDLDDGPRRPLMKCISCGATMPLDCQSVDELVAHMREHYKFTVNLEDTLLYGICSACSNGADE